MFDLHTKYKFDVHMILAHQDRCKRAWLDIVGEHLFDKKRGSNILMVGSFQVPCSLRIASHEWVD